jgi:DNA recombination protein RmuC
VGYCYRHPAPASFSTLPNLQYNIVEMAHRMNIQVIIVLGSAALAVGVIVGWLFARTRIAALEQRGTTLQQDLAAARSLLDGQSAEIRALVEAKAGLLSRLEAEREGFAEKQQLLADTAEQLKTHFKALAASALDNNNANFLELAKSTLATYQSEAKGELKAREQAVETLVKPIAESLKQVDEQVRQLEKSRSEAYGSLTAQVASLLDTQKILQTETGNLVKALREPQARGRWGEMQLHRVLEMAGMLEYCGDFEEQRTVTAGDRRFRPDVVVRLPGDKHIVIDAKAPLTAYLAALEAPDDATRNVRLSDHARQIRHHIDALSNKAYWAQFAATPEFVVLFLPGEVFFRAAMDVDAELIEYGVSQKVIVASPTTLIALLKAVAYGWNQKNLAERAREISESGKLVYERLCKMTGHLEDVGKKLGGAVKSYNEMLGSMERRVFPAARKLSDLDRSLSSDLLPELEQLENLPRELESPDWHSSEDAPALPFGEEQADRAKV